MTRRTKMATSTELSEAVRSILKENIDIEVAAASEVVRDLK